MDLTLEDLERLAAIGRPEPTRPEVKSHPFVARVVMVNRVTCDCGQVFECPRTTRPLLKRKALGSRHGAWELLPDTGGQVDLPLETQVAEQRVTACTRCLTHTPASHYLPGMEPAAPQGPHEVQVRDFYNSLLGTQTRRQAFLDRREENDQ
jgi:hypothetical protein